MKVAISVIWLIFTVLFLWLGMLHWSASKQDIPLFPTPKYKGLKRLGSIQIAGEHLDRPIKDFAKNFNAYLAQQNKTNRDANRYSAWGYFIASLTALVSMILEWRDSISNLFKNIHHKATELLQR